MNILSANFISHYTIDYINENRDSSRKMIEWALGNNDKTSYNTNVHAQRSGWQIFNETKLFDSTIKKIQTVIENSVWVEQKYPLEFINVWTAVYRNGDYAKPHNHLPSYLAFVMCLEDGGINHPLVFTDNGINIEMHTGKLVIFPAHINHHVPVYRHDNPRIVLAGNVEIYK